MNKVFSPRLHFRVSYKAATLKQAAIVETEEWDSAKTTNQNIKEGPLTIKT